MAGVEDSDCIARVQGSKGLGQPGGSCTDAPLSQSIESTGPRCTWQASNDQASPGATVDLTKQWFTPIAPCSRRRIPHLHQTSRVRREPGAARDWATDMTSSPGTSLASFHYSARTQRKCHHENNT